MIGQDGAVQERTQGRLGRFERFQPRSLTATTVVNFVFHVQFMWRLGERWHSDDLARNSVRPICRVLTSRSGTKRLECENGLEPIWVNALPPQVNVTMQRQQNLNVQHQGMLEGAGS